TPVRARVTVRVPMTVLRLITLSVEASPRNATVDQLVDMLRSVPATDPHAYRPRNGDHDLRDRLSAPWVISVLEAAGAQASAFDASSYAVTRPGESERASLLVKPLDS